MKRLVALILVVVMAFALSITAFAKTSPTNNEDGNNNNAGTGNAIRINIFNSDDKLIARVPADSVKIVTPGRAYRLDSEDEKAFLDAYEEAKKVEDKVVRACYWLDIPEKYKDMEGFAYAKYTFGSRGKNVSLTVNGKDMEVVSLGKGMYFAKLTEFGTIVITSD